MGKGGMGKGGGDGKSGGLGPMGKFLNQYCQLKAVKPTFEYTEVRAGFTGSSGWRCVLRIPGTGETQATGGNKRDAQEAATRDMVIRLQATGVMIRMPGKQEPAAPKGPSWAISGPLGPLGGGVAPRPLMNAPSPAGPALPPKKNITAELNKLTEFLRAGKAEEALALAEERLDGCPRAMSVKQLTKLMACTGVRSREAAVLSFLDGLTALEVPDFPNPAAAAYYWRFSRWAVREFLAEGAANENSAASMIPQALERQGACMAHLVIEESDKGATTFLLKPSAGQLPPGHAFNFGDWLFLTSPHTAQVRLHSENGGPTSLEAELVTILQPPQCGVVVKVVGLGAQEAKQLVGKTCRIDRAANHVVFCRQLDALVKVCISPGELDWLSLVLLSAEDGGHEKVAEYCSHFPPKAGFPAGSPVLRGANRSQFEALQAATTRRVTLIQGPPGAGKTSTAVLLMRLWTTTDRKPILATADSNIAADNLVAGAAAAGLSVIRVGRKEALRPDLQEYSLFEKARAAGGGGGPRHNWRSERRVIQEADVVCCTCAGAEHPAMQDQKFRNVLIDEAGQTTELASLIPMMHLEADGSVVLVGDHRQLPATVACLEADVEGLGTSLFERLATLGVPPALLDIQYRMHPAIAAFPSMQYYAGRLRSGTEGSVRQAPAGIQWPSQEAPIAFLPIQSTESQEGKSFINHVEANTIVELLSSLVAARDVKASEVGIITPYAAQARLFRAKLGIERRPGLGPGQGANANAPEVSSVDGFQGREKELIFISTVRANQAGKMGFIGDPRRLNVMLTRAKRGLVVIGDFNTLAQDPNGWRPWLLWAQERGLIVGCAATSSQAAQDLRKLHGLKQAELLVATAPAGSALAEEPLLGADAAGADGGANGAGGEGGGGEKGGKSAEGATKPKKKRSLLMQIREEAAKKSKEEAG